MSLWRELTRGLRVLVNRTAADRELADEFEHYLEQAAAEREALGLPPEDARRAARVEAGNVASVRDHVRAYGWEHAVDTIAGDLKHGARRLRRSPGFTAVSILTLALGIGASTAIFSAVYPVLFKPLPYPHPDRLVMVWDTGSDRSRIDVTFGTSVELAARSRSFEAMAVMKPWQPTMTGVAEPERLEGQRVGAGYFETLGVATMLGRGLRAADDTVNGPRVVIISESLWRRRFGGDAPAVGRQVALDDTACTIVGVMPRRFENVLAPLAAVINESFARRVFPGRDPLGQRLHVGPDTGPWYTVVGIAGDVKQMSLAGQKMDAVYVTAPQWHFADKARWIVVRARGDAAALAPAVRQAIWSVDRNQPVLRVATMEERVAASAAERRFARLHPRADLRIATGVPQRPSIFHEQHRKRHDGHDARRDGLPRGVEHEEGERARHQEGHQSFVLAGEDGERQEPGEVPRLQIGREPQDEQQEKTERVLHDRLGIGGAPCARMRGWRTRRST